MSNKKEEPVGVTDHDDNYLGTSPEYQNSAYEVTAPIVDEEDEIAERVREHVDAMVQPQPSASSFEDWVGNRQAEREGKPVSADDAADDEMTKAELMDEARDLQIEGRSSMTKDELAAAVEEARQTS